MKNHTAFFTFCSSPYSSTSKASFYQIVVTVVREFWIYSCKYFLHLFLNAQICSVNVRKKFSWDFKYVVFVFTLRGVFVNMQSIWIHNITENLVSLVKLDDVFTILFHNLFSFWFAVTQPNIYSHCISA